MEATKLTNEIAIDKDSFDELLIEKMSFYEDEYANQFNNLLNEVVTLFKQPIIKMQYKDQVCILHTKTRCLFPKLDSSFLLKVDPDTEYRFDKYMKSHSLLKEYSGEMPQLTRLRVIADYLDSDENTYYLCSCDETYRSMCGKYAAYLPYNDSVVPPEFLKIDPYAKLCVFPVHNLLYTTPAECLVDILLPAELCPEGLTEKGAKLFRDFAALKNKDKDYIVFNAFNKAADFKTGEITKTLIENPKLLHWNMTDIIMQCQESKCIEEVEMYVKEELLQCEKLRADIEAYEEKILTDPNRGHWDLWREQSEKDYTAIIEDSYVARNPLCDIKENGVIAIDFGTKSTIVVYQADIEHSLPMRIGDGNLSKKVTAKRYENPTVMHFVNLEKFLTDYHAKAGRPKTEWEDLTISHTAMEQFSASSSEEYYEYLHQIKQWAGQREKQFRIQPHEGESIVMPAFLDLGEEDINPIEIYAYYIGLYINNMRNGIYLDYYLSFPVTYEVKIREKIISSFEKGLRKSLPVTVLHNQEVMERFKVNGDISEPAAYAVCALQEYGFDPKEDEEVFYGIFDFGGGTTDFDFGLWKQSTKRRYDYSIDGFGAGGDQFLGGENLLEMLAFEIFKKNQELMREKGYTFTLAPKCNEFVGSDVLLSDSQEAEKNMRNLMEALRPFWEKDTVEKDTAGKAYVFHIDDDMELNEISEDKLLVTLFDREGNDHVNEALEYSLAEIDQFIEDKIREGVNNFFSALLLSYQNDKVKKPTTVNILLAGNSCKSPVVKKVFEEEIKKRQEDIKKKYQIKDVDNLFEIFPPLGTEEAYKKMEERGLTFERDNLEKPTGKTGVAFGLLQCRKGGNIERISNTGTETEIPFQYFIGWREKKKFVIFKDDTKLTKYKGKPDYNVWYKFIEADEDVFDLYYTTLPECVNGDTSVDGNAAVRRHRCNIDVVDENAFVYIRAVGPHTLEYVVAKNDDVENSMLGEISRKEFG